MIILSEVAQKLEKILNDQDGEVTATNPTGFYFQVETEGFHIDHIERKEKDGNFIPVFISSLGGQFNPVKGLKQGSYSFPVIFYFPVRFKEAFFALGDFLVDAFVGTILNYGEISGKAVSNISVPQFGEIQDLDLGQFGKWVESQYKKPIEVMEPYLTMQVTLFLSNAAPGLLYGNDVKINLAFTYGENTYTLDDVDWDGASLQSNAQAQSEQEEGTNEADGLPFGTAYGSSFKIYPNLETKAKESTTGNPIYFYKEILKAWLAGNIQEVEIKVTFKLGEDEDLKYERDCFIQSVVAPIEKGQIFSLTLTFAKKRKNQVYEQSTPIEFETEDFQDMGGGDYQAIVSGYDLSIFGDIDFDSVRILNYTAIIDYGHVDITENTAVVFDQTTHKFVATISHVTSPGSGDVVVDFSYELLE